MIEQFFIFDVFFRIGKEFFRIKEIGQL